jgi:cyclic pyranopterin phosphate synthase
MPQEGVEWKPHESMLSFEETLRICRVMAELGIRKIKVTGGEPLVRRGLALFLKNLKALPKIESVTLTTNGFLLGGYLDEAEALDQAALPDGINISLNALDPERFSRITRCNESRPEEMFPHIDRLLEKRIPLKINCVPIKGFNEEEIAPLAALARDRDIAVRFIELMPLGPAAAYRPVSRDEVAALIEKKFGVLVPASGVTGNGPAVYYSLSGFTGKIGFINPVTHGFCETCNRLRLTSVGVLKPCLSDEMGLDLRELLRSGISNKELAKAITGIAAQKPRFHTLSGVYGTPTARHPCGMSGIGG